MSSNRTKCFRCVGDIPNMIKYGKTKSRYLNMSYNKMHIITKKDLVHTVNKEQKGYVLDYNYDNELHPNAPNKIAETGKTLPREYVYDGNGNPTGYTEEKSFRKMTWDEENRLSGINDNGRIHPLFKVLS